MDKKQFNKCKGLLQARAEELRRSVSETQQESRIAQEVHGRDEGDRASRSHEKELLLQRNTQLRGLLNAIESALARINDGTFGECVQCGQEINTKRLEALPWTLYCITCQELLEQQR
jgi:DnaK suppressor protein